MSEATFEGHSLEAALEKAAAEMGAAADELEYELLEEKQDFWGLGDASVKIRAWQKAAAAASEAPGAPAADAEAREPTEAGDDREPAEPAAAHEAHDDEATSTADESERGAPRQADAEAPERTAPAAAEAPESAKKPSGGGFWSSEGAAGADSGGADVAPAVGPSIAETRDETGADDAETETGTAAAMERSDAAAPASARSEQPRREYSERAEPEAGDADPEAMRRLLEQIFHDMAFDCSATIEAQEGGFLASVEGADKELLLEGNGRCLSALELVLNNSFRHKLPTGQKIRVDAGDFRSRRDDEFADLAFQVAHSAKESGRTQETQPLNPYERRLVHLALADDPSVTTRSRGSGFLKNVQVIPRSSGGSGRRRR